MFGRRKKVRKMARFTKNSEGSSRLSDVLLKQSLCLADIADGMLQLVSEFVVVAETELDGGYYTRSHDVVFVVLQLFVKVVAQLQHLHTFFFVNIFHHWDYHSAVVGCFFVETDVDSVHLVSDDDSKVIHFRHFEM